MEQSKMDVKHWFQTAYIVSAVNPYFSSILDIHHLKLDLSLWVSLLFALWRFSFSKSSKLEMLVFHKLSIKYQPSIRISHMYFLCFLEAMLTILVCFHNLSQKIHLCNLNVPR